MSVPQSTARLRRPLRRRIRQRALRLSQEAYKAIVSEMEGRVRAGSLVSERIEEFVVAVVAV